jgi:hypothetical protein
LGDIILEKTNKECIFDIETTELYPWAGEIKVIGAKNINTNTIKQFFQKDEEILLRNFLNYFIKNKYKVIIGYNINYDIRYIFGRCLKYEINCNKLLMTPRIDLMTILKGPNTNINYNKPGRLNEWINSIGEYSKNIRKIPINNKIYSYNTEKLLRHNRDDLIKTEILWNKIKKISKSKNKITPLDNFIYSKPHAVTSRWCNECRKMEHDVKRTVWFFVLSLKRKFNVLDLFDGGGGFWMKKSVLLKKSLMTNSRVIFFLLEMVRR